MRPAPSPAPKPSPWKSEGAPVAPPPAAPAASTPKFTFNRLSIILGFGLTVLATWVFLDFHASGFLGQDATLLIPGLIGVIFVTSTGRAWAVLTGMILNILYPLAVIAVFGAYRGLYDPLVVNEFAAALGLVCALLLVVVGGLRGFLATRRKQPQSTAGGGWRTGFGVFATGLILLSVGSSATVLGAPSDEGGSLDFSPDTQFRLDAKDFEFSPKNFNLTRNEITEIVITNDDAQIHTFTYVGQDGKEYSHNIETKASASFAVLFKTAGTIKFRCVPHSTGYDEGMVGTMTIA